MFSRVSKIQLAFFLPLLVACGDKVDKLEGRLDRSKAVKVSAYLKNGRQALNPANLGEYAAFVKNPAPFAENRGARIVNAMRMDLVSDAYKPSDLGMRIEGAGWTQEGAAGKPNRWQIFVGKQKKVEFIFTADPLGSVKTTEVGPVLPATIVNVTPMVGAAGIFSGLYTTYDPITGIALVDAIEMAEGCTTRYVGFGYPDGSKVAHYQSSIYFDILISEMPEMQ